MGLYVHDSFVWFSRDGVGGGRPRPSSVMGAIALRSMEFALKRDGTDAVPERCQWATGVGRYGLLVGFYCRDNAFALRDDALKICSWRYHKQIA